MARTHGPLMSVAARGALGKSLIFQNQKGMGIVKKFAVPKNPKTEAQTANRTFFAELTAAWLELDSEQQAAWDGFEAAGYRSSKTHFIGVNMHRLRAGLNYFVTPGVELLTYPLILYVSDDSAASPLEAMGGYGFLDIYNGEPRYKLDGYDWYVMWDIISGQWVVTNNPLDVEFSDGWSTMAPMLSTYDQPFGLAEGSINVSDVQ
jgi:hypothetical protein